MQCVDIYNCIYLLYINFDLKFQIESPSDKGDIKPFHKAMVCFIAITQFAKQLEFNILS